MTLASEIIQQAFRQDNLLATGVSPTTAEQTEALSRLNSFITTLLGNEIGEQLTDWTVPPPQRNAPVAARFPLAPSASDLPSDVWPYPPANSRLTVSITSATTVYFPEKPDDGARMALVDLGMTATLTLNGNGRLIQTATTRTVLSTDADTGPLRWFYRGDTGNWILLATLVASDAVPFPEEFDDMLICGLSIRLSPRFKAAPRDTTVSLYQEGIKKLKARYRQNTPQIGGGGDIPNATQSYAPAGGNFGWM